MEGEKDLTASFKYIKDFKAIWELIIYCCSGNYSQTWQGKINIL